MRNMWTIIEMFETNDKIQLKTPFSKVLSDTIDTVPDTNTALAAVLNPAGISITPGVFCCGKYFFSLKPDGTQRPT